MTAGGATAAVWSGRAFLKLKTKPFLLDLEDRKVVLFHQIDDGFDFFDFFDFQRARSFGQG